MPLKGVTDMPKKAQDGGEKFSTKMMSYIYLLLK